MKHFIAQALTDALESAEHDRIVWGGAIERLRKDNGNPREIERREQWLAQTVESIIQFREALGEEFSEK